MSDWIRVEDRLPEENTPVLAGWAGWYSIFEYTYIDEDAGWQWAIGYQVLGWVEELGKLDVDAEWDDDYEITHWQPLPEPPGE